jgi:2-oxoglutarate ferredoxin oxidoreductase subunit alpha
MMARQMPPSGGVAVQGEDEIASIGMCIGAVSAGARAMTATSGPGMSLYSENLGLAVMSEIPLVVVDVQRLGPATGGPTATAQGDTQFVRWGTSGGYPIIALAPTSIPDCYHLTVRAFELAERFRCPVFVVVDKELGLTLNTVESADMKRGAAPKRPAPESPGPPYRYSPAGDVPPLRTFGSGETVRFTGSSHDEKAFITKDPATIDALNRHLAAKIEDHIDKIVLVDADIDPEASTLLLSYGVVAGAAGIAASILRRQGRRVSTVVVKSLWPLPEAALTAAAAGVQRVVVPELNLGQYRREIERLLPSVEVVGVNRVDGTLISAAEIVEAA